MGTKCQTLTTSKSKPNVFSYQLPSGQFTVLKLTTPYIAYADGINASGFIVGNLTGNSGVSRGGFTWNGSQLTRILVPKSASTTAIGLSDNGAAFGNYSTSVNTPNGAQSQDKGFMLSGKVYQSVSYPGSLHTFLAFSRPSNTFGGNYFDANSNGHGYLLSSGTFTTFDYPGSVAGYSGSGPVLGVTTAGAVIGVWRNANLPHGYVWQSGYYHGIDYPGALLTNINHVNSNGSLVGTYEDQSHIVHAFVAQCAAAQVPCTQ